MLHAGFARVDCTPGMDADLLGYDFRQASLPPGNAGVRDPLAVRALALDGGDGPALLLALDICVVSVPFARRLRARASAATAVPLDRVVLACSHTHSGPMLDDAEVIGDLRTALPHARDGGAGAIAATQRVEAAVAEAAARAVGLRVRVRAGVRSAACALAYDRRVPAGDGVRLCWNPREQHELVPQPTADDACTVLVLRPEADGRPMLVWNAGAHPVTLGKTSRVVSADWPGEADRVIAELTGGDGLFLLGACGDTHPWIATQDDGAQVRTIGTAAGGFVASLAQAALPRSAQGLSVRTQTVSISGVELDLSAWRIGDAVLLAAPVELFAGLGAALRRRIAAPVLLATNANGWTGYWPTREAFARGGYEVEAARAGGRAPGDGEALVDALVDLASGLSY